MERNSSKKEHKTFFQNYTAKIYRLKESAE